MLPRILCLGLALAAPLSASAALVTVNSLKGGVTLSQGDASRSLKKTDGLAERDAITVADGGRLSLALSKHGFLELGSGAQLSFEKLPFASYAAELRTVLRLSGGYLRVVWKHPGLSSSWPLFVNLGNYRVSLASGEYFFENEDGKLSLCVAGGEAAVTTPGAVEPETLEGPACYRLIAGASAQLIEREYEDFVPARQNYQLAALADTAPPPAPVVADARIPFNIAPKPLQGLKPAPDVAEKPAAAPARPVAAPSPAAAAVAPKPAAAAAPAPVAPPAAAPRPGTGGWTLNVSSYPEQANADRDAKLLTDAGYAAVVRPADVKGRQWYRVQVPGLASVAEARATAEQIKQKLGMKDAWVIKQ